MRRDPKTHTASKPTRLSLSHRTIDALLFVAKAIRSPMHKARNFKSAKICQVPIASGGSHHP